MTYLYPIKFAFGSTVPTELRSEQVEYYVQFFSSFLGKPYSIKKELIGSFKTIPIDEDSAQFSQLFLNEFKNVVSLSYGAIFNSKFKNPQDLVVIDLRGSIRKLNLLHLTNELSIILKNESIKNSNTRFALIVDSIEEGSNVFKSIENFIISKKVFIIDFWKRCLFGDLEVKINHDFSFDTITKSPIEKIKFKLIRKIGHFERKLGNLHQACNQYFYDGSYCISDVKDLIVNKMVRLLKDYSINIHKIVYHCPESPWLEDSIYKAHVELSRLKKLYGLDYSNKENLEDIKEISKSKFDILFIVDLIHSGETFKRTYKLLKYKFPNAQIRTISILNSGNHAEHEIDGFFRKIYLNHSSHVDIEFFLTVEQINYRNIYHNCPMCKYDLLPKVDSTYFGQDYLLSYEMWLMCDNAGYKIEDFQPVEERKKIDYMPHTIKIMEDNAPYLAYKFDKIIQKEALKNSSELILIFPDETTNELEIAIRKGGKINLVDTPSGYFAETLKQLKDYRYFTIPREIIRKIRKKIILLSDIPLEYPEFYKKLLRLPDDIIIFDEINNSGGTVNTILEILSIVNKTPIAYFPIFNFSPSTINTAYLNNIPVLSLYQFDLSQMS